MGTRSITKFIDQDGTMEAMVFRHWDGFPEVAGRDIHRFIKASARLADPRFGDMSILAARYVVFLSKQFRTPIWGTQKRSRNPIDFLSVRVMNYIPGDVEYIYHVVGTAETYGLVKPQKPTVRCFTAKTEWIDGKEVTVEGEEVPIPK